MKSLVIGVDLGGTKIEAVLFDGKRVRRVVRAATPTTTYAAVLTQVVDLVTQLRTKEVGAIGIGTPGYVHNGVLYGGPNTKLLNTKRLAGDLQKRLKLPVVHENDAKCFALAEARFGAAKGKQHVVGLIVGTGVGSGIVLDGHIIRGALGAAGEVGHMPYKDKDYEYYAAGPAILRNYARAGGKEPLSVEEILRTKRSVSQKALLAAREETYDALARLCASIINTCNPAVIVVGGGVAKSIDYTALRTRTKQYALPEPFAACIITKFKLSDSAGSIGAAFLALEIEKKERK
jgi:predicted NBD/HSP70 family sugar kinase